MRIADVYYTRRLVSFSAARHANEFACQIITTSRQRLVSRAEFQN
jgi:hypothetical protein